MSRVVVVKQVGIEQGSGLSLEQYRQLVEIGLRRLADKDDIKSAVRAFFPGGRIGMKANCLTGRGFSTRLALVGALLQLFSKNGIDDNDLLVWERSSRELGAAGFELNASSFGSRCYGTDAEGVGHSDKIYVSGEVNSLVSRILTDHVDHNISLPVLKDHSLAGLSGGMKNMYGGINNPNKYHGDNCDPYVADVCALDPVRRKHRLTILDAVDVQYNGGPGFMPSFMASYGGLIMSDDIVATDTIGLEIVEHIRAMHKLPTLGVDGRPVKYLESAERLGLGRNQRDQIELLVIEIDSTGRQSEGVLL